MKVIRTFSLFLAFFLLFAVTGCANIHKPDIEEVIIQELDLLKNLDTETTQKYISYKELFPDAAQSDSIPEEVEEVFSLYFQNFDYKILSLDVQDQTAVAGIRLQTIDAQTLAKDFAAARLAQYITAAADSSNTNDIPDDSLEAHYLLLNKILKENEYDTVETSCTMHLVKNDDTWYIQSDPTLENELVGGFITYLSDSSLLSAQEAANVYLRTIQGFDEEQFSSYLGLNETLNTEDSDKNALAETLISKVHLLFDYEILSSKEDGVTADVEVTFTTLDFPQILQNYDTMLNDYLATTDAVIDGEEGRTEKSLEFLLEEIENSQSASTVTTHITMMNDGMTWRLQSDNTIGSALFGTFAGTSQEESEEDPE